jgi:hypothetical protein
MAKVRFLTRPFSRKLARNKRGADAAENLGFYALGSKNFGLKRPS